MAQLIADTFAAYMKDEEYTIDPNFRPGILLQPLTLPHILNRENSIGLSTEQNPLLRKRSLLFEFLA